MARDLRRTPPAGMHPLAEPIKELECLRGIAELFATRGRSLESALRSVASLLVRGWQYPELACARISLKNLDIRTPGYEGCTFGLIEPIPTKGRAKGSIEVAYPPAAGGPAPFLDSEVDLLRAVCVLVGTMVEIVGSREALAKRTAQIRSSRAALHRKNIALEELLDHLEREKRRRSRRLRSTVGSVILPLVAAVRRPSLGPASRDRYAALLKSRLEELADSYGEAGVAELASRLSPREVEIADLVRSGITNKEIAEMVGISETTVERHRYNIRRRLGITDASVNLASYLSGL